MTNASTQPPPLFSPGDADDRAYCNVRDEVTEHARICKQFSQQLWDRYHPYADDHFLAEIRKDFNARFWEMYLTCTLLDNGPKLGYVVSCSKPGPDALVEHEGQRLWIEATVATDGDPTKPDSAVEDHSGNVPDEKILFRYANAIDTKHKKYLLYRDNGIIGKSDTYVIAINGYPLSYRWAEPEIPRILKALFPIGPLEMLIDRKTKMALGTRYQYRPAVKKISGSPVSTEIFLDQQYCGISAILYSCASGYGSSSPLGTDFILVHNPQASQPLPPGFLPCGREYRATAVKEGYEVVFQAGSLAAPEKEYQKSLASPVTPEMAE